jgi:hypothetical protein
LVDETRNVQSAAGDTAGCSGVTSRTRGTAGPGGSEAADTDTETGTETGTKRGDANWHSLIIKVTASLTPTGSVEIWWDGAKQTFKNGSQVLANLVTMNSSDWLGKGLPVDVNFYRNQGFILGTPMIYHGIHKIGTTFASVAPPAATGP